MMSDDLWHLWIGLILGVSGYQVGRLLWRRWRETRQ